MAEEKEALFSKQNKALLSDPLNDNNPISVQVLGICSAEQKLRVLREPKIKEF